MKCPYHAEGLYSLGVVGVPVQKCTRIKDWGEGGQNLYPLTTYRLGHDQSLSATGTVENNADGVILLRQK